MIRQPAILIATILMTSCYHKTTFDENGRMGKMGPPLRIEYYMHIERVAFQYADTPAFVLRDNQELNGALKEILNADNPKPWKGAGWDRIKICYRDTTLNIFTNRKKIGLNASGAFFDLSEQNFITTRLDER